jgi:NADH dehydrogenase [ubiquinone] 1 alpha subcomplex assembly factor 1
MSFVNTGYFKKSLKYIAQMGKNAFKFGPEPISQNLELYDFSSVASLKEFVVGSDADIGGYSECYWGLTNEKTALFWGNINKSTTGTSLDKSGYAGIKSIEKDYVLFHRERIDASLFRYLEIKAKGDDKLWMVNIMTEGLYPTILWQHRLRFRKPGEWETIRIPFRDFVRTSHGFVQQKQLAMDRRKIKSIGFSVLGQEGEFSLELKSLSAMNTKLTMGDFDKVTNPTPRKPIQWF